MVRGDPAFDGEKQAGEQREAAQRGKRADRNGKHRRRKCREPERAREDRARLAKECGW
jgi:hypothetical protein